MIDAFKGFPGFKVYSLDEFSEKNPFHDSLKNSTISESSDNTDIEQLKMDLLSAGTPVDTNELQAYFGRKIGNDITATGNRLRALKAKKIQTEKDKAEIEKLSAIVKQAFADKIKFGNGVHKSFLSKIVDESGNNFDLEQLKAAIKKRPGLKLKQNGKIEKSGTFLGQNGKMQRGAGSRIFYNIGLPALRGIAVNEKTDEIVVVDTCPGAGKCVPYCYAMNGGYIMFPEVWLSQARILNYLINDPVGFFKELKQAILSAQKKAEKNGDTVVVRYHDAGDFFSPAYLAFAAKLAREMPDVDFYAYTKVGNNIISDLPDNLILNWSEDAKSADKKVIKIALDNGKQIKNSLTIPSEMFSDLIQKVNNGRPDYDENGKFIWLGDGLQEFKQRIAKKYGFDVSTVITFNEMLTKEETNVPTWNVIVQSREPDDSARRRDVANTLLVFH